MQSSKLLGDPLSFLEMILRPSGIRQDRGDWVRFALRCSICALAELYGGCPGLRLHRIGLAACMVWLDAHSSSLPAPPGITNSHWSLVTGQGSEVRGPRTTNQAPSTKHQAPSTKHQPTAYRLPTDPPTHRHTDTPTHRPTLFSDPRVRCRYPPCFGEAEREKKSRGRAGCARWSAMLGGFSRRRTDGGPDGPRSLVGFRGGAGGAQRQAIRGSDEGRGTSW